MPTRRETLKHSAAVAGLLATAGFPQFAHAAFNKAGFDAKSVQDAVKAYGGATIAESKDVTITGPDIPRTVRWCPWAPPPACRVSSRC